jgi:DnaJ-class molecular chaperone
MKEGERIVFYGEGDATEQKMAGDLVFIVRSAKHERFVRDGINLKTKMIIPLVDALVGFKTTIKHLDGKEHEIVSNEIITEGKVVKIIGLGMPNPEGGKGDLFIEYSLKFPSSLSEEQKQSLKKIL